MKRIYIGGRESEISTYNIFDLSITFYGSNKLNNRSYNIGDRIPKEYSNLFYIYVISTLEDYINKNIDIVIHVYNRKIATEIIKRKPEYLKYFQCINNNNVISWLNDKIYTRLWMKNVVEIPPTLLCSLEDINIPNFKNYFGDFESYILQEAISSGGKGTFILKNNVLYLKKVLSKTVPYMVSPNYTDYDSLSCHMIIGKYDSIIFPFSKQILNEIDSHFQYVGANYYSYKFYDLKTKNRIYDFCKKIANQLNKISYRGICGIDFLLSKEHIYFIEINARYQGSTFLINKALLENDLPSIFELNELAFKEKNLYPYKKRLENLEINYSSHYVFNNYSNELELNSQHLKEFFYDGFDECNNIIETDEEVYMYRWINLYK